METAIQMLQYGEGIKSIRPPGTSTSTVTVVIATTGPGQRGRMVYFRSGHPPAPRGDTSAEKGFLQNNLTIITFQFAFL